MGWGWGFRIRRSFRDSIYIDALQGLGNLIVTSAILSAKR